MSRQYDVIDTAAHLQRTLDRLGRIRPAPRALVFTGDLADLAEPAAYRRLRELVEPMAERIGAEVVWVMGNHDERAAYSRELFGEESEASQDRVHHVDGLRIIALDTTVPGWHHGQLTAGQLRWLADELETPAPLGTVLALHHPPIPSPMVPLEAVIELQDQSALADVVRGTDVRAVIGGHYHHTSVSTFAGGVPVLVAAATCYTLDMAPDQRIISSIDAHQSFNMMHLYDDRVVTTVVPIDDSPEIHGYGEDMRPLLDAMAPEELFEMVARKDSAFNAQPDGPAIE